MEQVIVNLVQNAADALVESGTSGPKINIEINSQKIPGHICIDIIDNGPGISEANKEKIFQTFFTTKEIGKGTGLGLSISNRILESHQGKLELVDSQSGAIFRIILPSVSISSYMSGGWEKMYTSIDQYKKVLVIDNEPSILNLCMSFMKTTDFYFLGSTSASEAFSLLDRVAIDLIVTDLKMPDISGIEFVKKLRASGSQIPVYYMSSKDSLEKFKQTKDELNIAGVILKPFSRDEFITAIDVGLYGKR
jgi:CheY-like chemotaxis protein